MPPRPMSETRIYVDQPLQPGESVPVPAAPSRHLIDVLRLTAGSRVTLFNGDGLDYPGRLVRAHSKGAVVSLETRSDPPEPPAALPIHLGVGISRGERMDFALQKAVELGVVGISPLFTERTLVRLPGERLAKRHQHWWGVVIAACEQSGRRRPPTLTPPRALGDWLAEDQSGGLILDPNGEHSLADFDSAPPAVTLLVGPEGGLSAKEREAARQMGFTGLRLGPRILRTETAPLAAIAALQALWGDLRD